MENSVASLNQGFINSHVNISIRLHCTERYIAPEVSSGQLGEFGRYKGSKERLHGTADLTVLLTAKNGCGVATYKTTAFPVAQAQKWCAESYFTVGHEFGHNLGAHHDQEQVGSNVDFNRGWLIQDTKKRTNMAYNSDGQHGKKINYYSDDLNVDADDDTIGGDMADNSRMTNERRFMYELIGDESQQCTENFGNLGETV